MTGLDDIVFAVVVILAVIFAGNKHLGRPTFLKQHLDHHLSLLSSTHGIQAGEYFALMPGVSARVFQTEQNAAGGAPTMLILEALLDDDQPPFPLTLRTQRRRFNRTSVGGRIDQLDLETQHDGETLAFWSLMNRDMRIWLSSHDVAIEPRRAVVALFDSRFDRYSKIGVMVHHLTREATPFTDLVARLRAPNHALAFLGILTHEQPGTMRRRALADWFSGDYRAQLTADMIPPAGASPTVEWLWVALDCGRLPRAEELETLLYVRADQVTEAAHKKNLLRMVLKRQTAEGRQALLAMLLNAPAYTADIGDAFIDYQDPAMNASLMAAYTAAPELTHVLRLLSVADQPEVIAFLVDVVRTGRRAAKEEAAKQLAEHGDRAALAALGAARGEVRMVGSLALERAYARLHQRLGTRPEHAGAISPVTPDGAAGAISPASAHNGAVSPVPAPNEPKPPTPKEP